MENQIRFQTLFTGQSDKNGWICVFHLVFDSSRSRRFVAGTVALCSRACCLHRSCLKSCMRLSNNSLRSKTILEKRANSRAILKLNLNSLLLTILVVKNNKSA